MQVPLVDLASAHSPMFSVVIPTMNEPLIQSLVDKVHFELAFIDHEVIVVDKSDSPPPLNSARVFRQNSSGLGHAILEGVSAARGEIVAVMDGDFSHRPEDLSSIVKRLGPWDFILGSRYLDQGKNLDIAYRRIVSWLFNRIARLILRLDFSDPMSGLIVARKTVFEKTRPNPIGFKLNLELIYRSKQLGFKGEEAPIIFSPRLSGKSKASVKEAVRTLSYILSLRFRKP
jgi:dolichol-phosphate mannosyltransferase